MKSLKKENWSPFISDYLSFGWKQDSYEFLAIEYSQEKITGYIKVSSYFLPNTDDFHFTVPVAFIIVSQLGIIHGCLDNNLEKKSQEIFLREITLKCKEIISSTEIIKIELEVIRKKTIENGVFYYGKVSINNNAFQGQAKYILPLK